MRQRDTQADRQIDKHTDRLANSQTDRPTGYQVSTQVRRQKDTLCMDRETERQADRHQERHKKEPKNLRISYTDKQTEIQTVVIFFLYLNVSLYLKTVNVLPNQMTIQILGRCF